MRKVLYTAFLAGVVLSTASCTDFMNPKSNSQLTLDQFFTSYEDCRAATAPLYNVVWFDFNSTFSYGLGDGRGNNIMAPWSNYIFPYNNLSESGTTATLINAWQALSVVITQSDYVINNLNIGLKNGVSEAQVNACKGEARFMRAMAYWYMGALWGNVIIIEDPQKLIKNSVVNTNPFEDVLEFSIRDAEFAAQWLPATDPDKGRLTKWSAYGLLSKLYMTAACYARGSHYSSRYTTTADQWYAKAKEAARKVVEDSGLKLLPNYEDLFKVQFNNNEESLFALQWVPNSTYGTTNFTQCYLAPTSDVTGTSSAWGNSTYAAGDIIELMWTRGEKIRRDATYMCNGISYNYLTNYRTGVSPYVVDASGIQNKAWIKKGVVGGTKDTGGLMTDQNSCWINPMLRLADVYLIYCEASIGSGSTTSDALALSCFNKIRTRAGLSATYTSINLADTWDERRCELAMEGQFWYDMVRRSYWDQAYVLGYMNAQNRARSYKFDPAANTFTWGDAITDSQLNPATAGRMLLPYPEPDLVRNPLLKQAPVPYTFSN